MTTALVILRLLRLRPWLLAGTLAFAVATFGLPLLTGLALRAFFDALAEAAAAPGAVAVIAVLVAIGLAGALSGVGLSLGWMSLRYGGTAVLRRNLLAALLTAPDVATPAAAPGALLSRFRDDVDEVVESIDAWIDLFGRSIFAAAALLIMLRIDPVLTGAIFVPYVIAITAVNLARGRIVDLRTRSQAATAGVVGLLGDLFTAAPTIALADAAPRAVAHLRRLGAARRDAALRDRLAHELIEAFNANVASLGTGALLLLAAGSMQAARFSVGDLALFVVYLGEVMWFGDEIARWLISYSQAGASLDRLMAVRPGLTPAALTTPTPLLEDRRPPAASSPLEQLTVAGLSARPAGGGRGVAEVSFSLRRGELVVITGRIGSGKTTLLRALLGLIPLQAGQILWNGRPVAEPARFFGPPLTAFTPQVPRLFSESLGENILLGLPEAAVDLRGAVAAAVLEEDLAALPLGLATPVGARGVRLSGGQVQRTAAARMFVRRPDLLVVDDLSSALDVETERRLWERLLADPAATVLAVSHRRAALRRADRVVVLAEGRLAGFGPLDELLADCAEMRHLWRVADDATPSDDDYPSSTAPR